MSLFPTVGTEKKGGKNVLIIIIYFYICYLFTGIIYKNKIKSVLFGVIELVIENPA